MKNNKLKTDKPTHGHVKRVYHRPAKQGRGLTFKHFKEVYCQKCEDYLHTELNNPFCDECGTRWEKEL